MGRTFVEVVLEGPRGRARGFVEGFLTGRGIRESLLDAEEEGFERDSLREQVRELLRPGTEVLHLLVPAEALETVREAAGAAGSHGIALAVRAVRAISGARFGFAFSAFSPLLGQRLVSLLSDLPEGVRLLPDRPYEEKIDREARGIEAYAPAHEYELHGKGTVEGDVEGVLAMHRRLGEEPAVRLGRAELVVAGP